MKFPKTLLLFCSLFLLVGCYDDMDDVIRPTSSLDIKNFIWRGMNNIYLYKGQVPDLADDRFANQEELNEFLNTFSSPEDLFYNGLVAAEDEFSFLVDDYIELEKSLDGIRVSNGMEFGLRRYSEGSNNVLGYVRYVLPNTSAEEKGIERGMIFNTIDGVQLTVDNYSRLLEPETYTIGLANIEDGTISSTGETITLEKEEYTTNPIFISKIIPTENARVGYLMYNGFTGTFDGVLNETFGLFKAENITHLVVDLRYNGGGSVETANDLASMITGQNKGEVFYTEQWNDDYQTYFEENSPDDLINRFNSTIRTGEQINSLNLNEVYVITTLRTASASELLINGLDPYINVIQVGEATTGKFQASTTLYDSPDFNRSDANPGHTYAIQPLIYKTLNAVGRTDYYNGLAPDIEITEDIENLGTLGDPQEPLLNAALKAIMGIPQDFSATKRRTISGDIGGSGMDDLLYQKMYSEKEALPKQPEQIN
ncbi:C-terminal processing protease CtpA/Prc, contains a PDZ domain [Salinimicrobium catena]|uniref:C-terminal processing protease CtpA/Prc, contains a PDZ domain n=1 Tax=Salinimicrobium catena TaxID=390640 RepID=A0A1H5P3F0_9FLAO|nr:S41 family peptidase [Salinimicrobium catena]SDL67282.1 C-terminal processing protease CtpA/Prc, contains a PDZ domain [Salinimicrobium catena]SEF08375.1 C-terminal processing protease CtpA/Prc, contains a PDZ domain [Salinimicrobium catena]